MGKLESNSRALEWFFSHGISTFWRSGFGEILERQEARYYDSAGHAIPLVPSEQRWSYMYVKPDVVTDRAVAYEVEHETLIRFAQVSRKLLAVEHHDPRLVSVLAAYHGDRGARWGAEMRLGPWAMRTIAVYPLTDTGAKWIRALIDKQGADLDGLLRSKDAKKRHKARETLDVLPDERLVAELIVQRSQPNELRQARLLKIEREAQELFCAAHRVYEGAPDARRTA